MPIPGFDGFHVVRDLFPKFFYNFSDSAYRYQFLIFMVLLLPILPGDQSVFTYIVQLPASWLFNLFINIAGCILNRKMYYNESGVEIPLSLCH